MTNQPSSSAKEKVLAFVRKYNPSTMELKFGCRVNCGNQVGKYVLDKCDGSYILNTGIYHGSISPNQILGSDMGKQEFEIALRSIHGKNNVHVGWHSNHPFGSDGFYEGMFVYHIQHKEGSLNLPFDLSKNLHNQSPDFYTSLLPLITTQLP